jgi:hypothetical protein
MRRNMGPPMMSKAIGFGLESIVLDIILLFQWAAIFN